MSDERTHTKRQIVYFVLSGIFLTNALLGEMTGGKLFQVGSGALSIGVLNWPVVFLTTDLINEYFGTEGVKRLTWLTAVLILYAFVVLLIDMHVPAASFSPVTDMAFNAVFGQSLWIIVGSLTAFLLSQYIDVFVFWMFRHKTQGKWLWLRATGSTAVSQLVDSFVVLGIAFWLPGKLSFAQFIHVSASNYAYKLGIAILVTPLIYAAHAFIDRYGLHLEDARDSHTLNL